MIDNETLREAADTIRDFKLMLAVPAWAKNPLEYTRHLTRLQDKLDTALMALPSMPEVPKPHKGWPCKGWVNIYRVNDETLYVGSQVFGSRDFADQADINSRIACVEVHWEE